MPVDLILCKNSTDDASITGDDVIVHAVHPNHWAPIIDAPGRYRPISVSFKESSNGTGNSINLWAVLQKHELPKTFMPPPAERWKDHGFVEFVAALPRSEGVKLVRMPLDENPAHAGMCNLSDDAKAKLSRQSTVLVLGNPRK